MYDFEFLKYVNFQGDENWNDKRTFYFNLSKKKILQKIYRFIYIYIFFWIIYRYNDWYEN